MSGAGAAIRLGTVAVFIAFGIAGLLTGQYAGNRLPTRAPRYAFVALLFAV